MSDDLDGLLRAAVRAEAPDWLEPLVTARAVARVEREASFIDRASRRVRDGVTGFARAMRRRALAGARWARERSPLLRPRAVLLGASVPTKGD